MNLAAVRQPVDLEVAVEGDDASEPLALGGADERGIGEIHRHVVGISASVV